MSDGGYLAFSVCIGMAGLFAGGALAAAVCLVAGIGPDRAPDVFALLGALGGIAGVLVGQHWARERERRGL